MKKKSSKKKATKVKKIKVSPKAKTSGTKVGVIPMNDRVIVKPVSKDEGTMTSFGIIIPDSAKEKPEQGTVVAVGPGKKNDDGKVVPLSVKVGDKIMFSKYGFDEIKVDGIEYYILPESSILAVIQK
jgi:chaperonin GroES